MIDVIPVIIMMRVLMLKQVNLTLSATNLIMWHIRKIVQKVRKQKMNEMLEVVIRIPKRTYDRVSERGIIAFGDDAYYIGHAIANGTVLPKGHGQVDILNKITNLFNRLNNGEIDDNQYYFQMQNLLLFGKELLEVENADSN